MKEIELKPTPLKGSIKVPPSKSLGHRAIIAAALAKGSSIINNIVSSEDISATIDAVRALGAKVNIDENKAYIKGTDFREIISNTIDCRESGSTLRFLIPLGLLANKAIKYVGSGNLGSRPLDPYIEIFKEQSIQYNSTKLPFTLEGKLKPDEYQLKGNISSQFFTGLMFALPLLEESSDIYVSGPLESKAYIDLTIDSLKAFGVNIENHDYKHFHIEGHQSYKPIEYSVEGDYSQAAFWLAAGLLGEQIQCTNLSSDSKQADRAFIDILRSSGAQIDITERTVTAKKSVLRAFEADVSQYPDIAPILAVVAAVTDGTTRITGAARLKIKECDRLKAISSELNKIGAEIVEGDDFLIIKGKTNLTGGVVETWGDHRIAMALSIASIKCNAPLIIKNSGVVSKSYPHFFKDFAELGGIINERSLG